MTIMTITIMTMTIMTMSITTVNTRQQQELKQLNRKQNAKLIGKTTIISFDLVIEARVVSAPTVAA